MFISLDIEQFNKNNIIISEKTRNNVIDDSFFSIWYDAIFSLLDAPKPHATDPPNNIQFSFFISRITILWGQHEL